VSDARMMIGSPAVPLRLRGLQRLLRPAERLYAIVVLSVVSGAYLPAFARAANPATEPDMTVAHVVLVPLYAVMCGIILMKPRGFLRTSTRAGWAWALVALAITSTLWSEEPGLTLRRSVALVAPTALGVVLAQRFTRPELLRILGWSLGIAAVLSVFVSLALPSVGISTLNEYGSAWQGVFTNKNSLGRAMAFASTTLVLVAMQSSRGRWLPWSAAGLTLTLVLLSRSASSLLIVFGMLALIPLFRSLRLRTPAAGAVWFGAVLLGVIGLTVALANESVVFDALGRDATLTGRTTLWAVVLASIGEQPWLGHGYNAFWQGWSGSSALVLSEVGWDTPHAHNGFLDLALDLGLLGMALLVTALTVASRAALRSARTSALASGVWPLVFLSFLLLINVTESSLLRQHNIYWILFVAVLCSDPPAETNGRPVTTNSGRPASTLGVRRAVRSRRTNE
jgi:exopolysaccharide production protein ExoQ